jgi:YfiH family protein
VQSIIKSVTEVSDGDAKKEEVQKSVLKNLGLDWNQLITCQQVHGDQIAIVKNAQTCVFYQTDGLMTDVSGLVLGVFVADCVPIFLYEPEHQVIGILHSGWRGTAQKIAAKAIRLIHQQWNAKPDQILVEIGPHIQNCCYEVGPEVSSLFPENCSEPSGRKQKLNLQRVIVCQFKEAGVDEKNITLNPDCTFSDPRFFSYRRDKTQARMLAYISKNSSKL